MQILRRDPPHGQIPQEGDQEAEVAPVVLHGPWRQPIRLDGDQEILDGMRALLGRWQVEVICA
ncbi:MAG: hypothetical protein ACK4OK_10540, partial [Thermoflexus sp.]